MKAGSRDLVIFDLDDTLYREINYLKSAYGEIAFFTDENRSEEIFNFLIRIYHEKGDPFGELTKKFAPGISKNELLKMYREHIPNISLADGADAFLSKLKSAGVKTGLLTDGRSITQRNKITALNIDDIFDEVIISEEFGSEKPDLRNFTYFEDRYPGYSKTYIADNFNKDFISPNQLGWKTIGVVDNGDNIHPQNYDLPEEYIPKHTIGSFEEIRVIVEN